MIPVDSDNLDQAIQVFTDAFHDDPVMNWTGNNPDSIRPFFDITVPTYYPQGLTYLDPQGRGGASWLGPGQRLNWSYSLKNLREVLRMGGLRGAYRMVISGMRTEKEHPKEPHYYLFLIGVVPGNQGKGIGSALISHVLRRCDEEGVPAYLENSKPQNLPFYRGHGFEVMKEIRFARSAPPLWLMWREPKTLTKQDPEKPGP